MTQVRNFADVAEAYAAASLSLRNRVINGDHSVWQRGNGPFSGGGAMSSDCWTNAGGAPNTTTITRNSQPGWSSLRMVWSGGGGAGQSGTWTRLEFPGLYSAQPLMFAFDAKGDAACSLATYYDIVYGSGGSAAQVLNNIKIHSISTLWQRYYMPFTGIDQSGKVYGTNPFISLCFMTDNGSVTGLPRQASGAIEIRNVQLEFGNVATPFELKLPGQELSLCQRFFCKSYNEWDAPGTVTSSGCLFSSLQTAMGGYAKVGDAYFPVTMRAVPIVNIYSTSTGALGKISTGAGDVNGDVPAAAIGQRSAPIRLSGTPQSSDCWVQWTASSEF